MLKIYNSLTRQKEPLAPITPGEIKLYVCGMTVYDFCHLGHGRVLVAFDAITRYLRACGYNVRYVRNITDIDDKIIQRAAANGESIDALTHRFIKAMHEDLEKLGVLPVDEEPRATHFMSEMIGLISRLIDNGLAYVAANGDVYFSVEKFPEYGRLAHKDLEGLMAGARVEIVDVKRNPLDFVLWKLSKPHEPKWDSPWGAGRPGWHIECSAMSMHCLGEHFDLHGGGFDLQFPHHENEIAQSCGAGAQFVNAWMHVGFLQINKEKMSKSLGNFFTLRDVMAQYAPEVVRYFLLTSHYRSPLNYSVENLDLAKSALERFYLVLRDVPPAASAPLKNTSFHERFHAAMDDDFNTPEAFAVLFDLVTEIYRLEQGNNSDEARALSTVLKALANILGFLESSPEEFLKSDVTEEEAREIEMLIQQRHEARQKKQWTEADRIRDVLIARGIQLEDKGDQTIWRKA